ncbi:hypothetical protein FACS1894201_10850 [Bacteroidia bacterium]|nr:hypothetical protein FACS1894201_10850 [Bacteroidia bacterium]
MTIRAEDNERTNNLKVGVEIGRDLFNGVVIRPDRVRQNSSGYGLFGLNAHYSNLSLISYIGAKAEYFLWNNRIGIGAGLRFSMYNSTFSSNKGSFLWLLKEDGLTTDYVRIIHITQKSPYIGVPLEFRFFPNNHDWFVQYYVKVGVMFNYRLSTNDSVTFLNPAMNLHAETVMNQVDDPPNFNAYLYPVIGLKLARCPWFNLEIHVPCVMFRSKNATSTQLNADETATAGAGIQFSIQIPLGTNYKMGTGD